MSIWEIIVGISVVMGVIGGILTILIILLEGFEGKIRRLLKLGQRIMVYSWDESISRRIGSAKKRVWVLQTWIPSFRRAEKPHWEEALNKQGIQFRVLLLDKELIPLRLAYRDPVEPELEQSLNEIKNLVSHNAGRIKKLEAHFYKCIPFGPIYIIDNDIYWGIYIAHTDSLRGPAFHCRADSEIGSQIIECYERIWERTKGLEIQLTG